jgi:DNA-binding CsgD family transcriptional regulator
MASLRDPAILSWLEYAYAPAPSLEVWLAKVTEFLVALGPGTLGAVGRIVRIRGDSTRELLCPYAIAVERGQLVRALEAHAESSQHRLDLVEGGAGLRDMRRRADAMLSSDRYVSSMVERFERLGVRNLYHLTAHDGTGAFVSVGMMTSSAGRFGISRTLWALLAEHLESAFRLQLRLGAELRAALTTDASGHLLDEQRTNEAWNGILDGGWSVVVLEDRGAGRRVIAIPTQPGSRDARGLTQREAQVTAFTVQGYSDKHIAYTLGIARSTVAGYLADAMWKLGFRSRLELMRALRSPALAVAAGDAPLIAPRGELIAQELPNGAVALDVLPASTASLMAKLTPAQARVVQLALQGRSDLEIARALGRSRHTVSNLLRAAYAHLGIGRRCELATLLDPTPPSGRSPSRSYRHAGEGGQART